MPSALHLLSMSLQPRNPGAQSFLCHFPYGQTTGLWDEMGTPPLLAQLQHVVHNPWQNTEGCGPVEGEADASYRCGTLHPSFLMPVFGRDCLGTFFLLSKSSCLEWRASPGGRHASFCIWEVDEESLRVHVIRTHMFLMALLFSKTRQGIKFYQISAHRDAQQVVSKVGEEAEV